MARAANRRPSNPSFKYCDECETKFYPTGRSARICIGCQNKWRLELARKKAIEMHEKLSMTVEKQDMWEGSDGILSEDTMNTVKKVIGKHRYIYNSNAGRITLVHILTSLNGEKMWEISMDGRLGKSKTERFPTKKVADKRIKELLI